MSSTANAVTRSVANMSMLAVIRSGSLPLTHSWAPPVSKTAHAVSTMMTVSSLDFSESALVCLIA